MLDSLTPEQFDEWMAYYLLEPWGDEWLQAGTVAAEVRNAGLRSLAAAGVEVDDRDLRKPSQFVPKIRKNRLPSGKRRMNGREMENAMRARFGV